MYFLSVSLQTAIMKFVTLAFAVVLAVGCQAASLQADAPAPLPTHLEHARGLMRMALDQVKASAHSIADKVTDQETKDLIKQKTDDVFDRITALQTQVAPMTDGAVQTIDEATRDMRASIHADIENLQKELEPMRAELRAVIDKHVDEYKTLLQPIMEDYRAKQEEQMAVWKAKLEPVMDELRAKIEVNVEETKSKLVPIVEKIRAKITERVEAVKEMVDPYVQEYKEQMKQAYSQATTSTTMMSGRSWSPTWHLSRPALIIS
uniref:Uncharacterized protein n=1 Tax=Neogobius melanostomus TaxID=47308 RepID=A0A8C6THQ9_9GOBI